MKKNRFLLLLAFLFLCFNLIAQNDFRKGYVITHENDTIIGEVAYKSKVASYKSCVFKKDEKITVYSPSELLKYGIDNDRTFVSGIVPGIFIELLLKGDLSLYKKNSRFYLQKEGRIYPLKEHKTVQRNGYEIEVEDNRWRGMLRLLIHDNDKMNMRANTYSYSERFLTEIVKKYNSNKGVAFVESKSNVAWNKISFGFVSGLSYEMLSVDNSSSDYEYFDSSYSTTAPFVGLYFNTRSPRLTDRLSLQVEFLYSKMNFSSTVVKERHSNKYYYDTFIDLSKINIPISVMYDFPERKYTWHIQAGGVLENNISADYKRLVDQVNNSVVVSSEFNDFKVVSNQFGVWAGASVSRDFKHFNGSLALRYYKSNSLIKDHFLDVTQNRMSLSILISTK